MKSFRIAGVLLLGAGLLTACASDGPPGRGGPPDGAAGGRRAQIFISPAGEPYRPEDGAQPMRQWFDRADLNHDGLLTAAEFDADQLRFFAIVDLDKDGVISSVEVRNYEENIAPEILAANERADLQTVPEEPIPGDVARIPNGRNGGGQGGGGRGGRGGPLMTGGGFVENGRQGAGRFGLINEAEPLRAADADFDYKVTLAEWLAASARRFGLLDTNKDGKIAFSELRGPPKQSLDRSSGPPAGSMRGRGQRR
jgi:hypothetical protein